MALSERVTRCMGTIIMRKIGFLITLLLVLGYASVEAAMSWREAVRLHPRVQVKAAELAQQQWKLAEREADAGFDIRMATQGHLPLYEHYSGEFTRVSEQDPYLDLVVEAKRTLFDSGADAALVGVEQALLSRAQLDYENTLEEQLHNLCVLVEQYEAAHNLVGKIQLGLAALQEVEGKQQLRFKAGLGSLSEVRQTQLSIMQWQSQMDQSSAELAELERTVELDYSLSIDAFVNHCSASRSSHLVDNTPTPVDLRSAEVSQHTQQSIRRRLANVQAQGKPSVDLSLNYTFYDVTRSAHNQRLAASVELTMPAFDNGRKEAQMGGLREELRAEQDRYHQQLLRKQVEFNVTDTNVNDLIALRADQYKRLDTLKLQLADLMLTQGSTQTDLSGWANILGQMLATEQQLTDNNKQISQGQMKKLLLNEQLLNAINWHKDG